MNYPQLERDLYDAFNELKIVLENPNLKQFFQDVKQRDLNESMNGHITHNKKRRLNDKIVNRLYFYLINGFSSLAAKKQLCVEFELEFKYIDELVTPYITRFRNDIKPEKIYAAEKLHAAGVTKTKIAELLNVSIATLNNLLSITSRC